MLNDLIAKLEAATQGSRALDVRVALTTGWRRIRITAPHFTTSIDAASLLVPEGSFIDISTAGRGGFCAVCILPGVEPEPGPLSYLYAKTMPLALAAAALKARGAGRG